MDSARSIDPTALGGTTGAIESGVLMIRCCIETLQSH
jgi:hypothetical protein